MARTKTASSGPASVHAAAEIPDYRAVFQSNGAAFAAAMKASEAMLHGLAEMNREMMSFASDRLRKGFETSESLMGCHDPAQAFSVSAGKAPSQFPCRKMFRSLSRVINSWSRAWALGVTST